MSGEEMRDEWRAVEGRRAIVECDDLWQIANVTQQDWNGTGRPIFHWG